MKERSREGVSDHGLRCQSQTTCWKYWNIVPNSGRGSIHRHVPQYSELRFKLSAWQCHIFKFCFLKFSSIQKGQDGSIEFNGSWYSVCSKKWTGYCLILWPLETGKIELLNQPTDCLLVPLIKHSFSPIHPRVALIFLFNRFGYSSRTSVLKRFQGSRREVGGTYLGSGSAVRCVCVYWGVCMCPNFHIYRRWLSLVRSKNMLFPQCDECCLWFASCLQATFVALFIYLWKSHPRCHI